LDIHVLGIAGLVLIFVIATTRPINLGALALVATFVLGAFVARESAGEMLAGFPADLFVLLAGVTYLFAVAARNGTVDRVVEGAAGLFRGQRYMIPWTAFVLASLPAMAGALGSAGVAMLAPLALRLARRYDIDRRMVGLMVVHGAAAGNFSPLNALGVIVASAVERGGLAMSAATLFVANIAYNVVLAAIIFVIFGGLRLTRTAVGSGANLVAPVAGARMTAAQAVTIVALIGVAVAALVYGLNVGLLALGAAVIIQLAFPASTEGADRSIAWGVVLLVCGVVTYVSALQRYGTIQAVGDGLAGIGSVSLTALLICAVGAVTSAFASSAGILGAMMPLALPFMARGDVDTTGFVVALAISATVVDSAPFSTVGALVVANADDDERARVYRGLLWWGAAMVVTAPIVTWLLFV
jgi:Na+/H+ antiporter NhaC